MGKVFKSEQDYAGGFNINQVKLTIGPGISGHLAQNIQFSFTQQVTAFYELGSPDVYLIGGRVQGQASMAKVVGPNGISTVFYSRFSDMCKPEDMGLSLEPEEGCNDASGEYLLIDTVMTSMSVSVQTQDVVINEQMQFIFIDLEVSG